METIIQKQVEIVKHLQTIHNIKKIIILKEMLKLLRMKLDRLLTLPPKKMSQKCRSWPLLYHHSYC